MTCQVGRRHIHHTCPPRYRRGSFKCSTLLQQIALGPRGSRLDEAARWPWPAGRDTRCSCTCVRSVLFFLKYACYVVAFTGRIGHTVSWRWLVQIAETRRDFFFPQRYLFDMCVWAQYKARKVGILARVVSFGLRLDWVVSPALGILGPGTSVPTAEEVTERQSGSGLGQYALCMVVDQADPRNRVPKPQGVKRKQPFLSQTSSISSV